MPLWIDFCASSIEILTIITIIALLDPQNDITPVQTLGVVIVECGLTLLLDVYDVGFHMIYIILIWTVLYYLFTKNKPLYLFIDISFSYAVYITLQLTTSILIYRFAGNILGNYCVLFFFLFLYLTLSILVIKYARISVFRKHYKDNRAFISLIVLSLLLFTSTMLYLWRKYNEIFFQGKWVLLVMLLLNYILIGGIFGLYFKKKQQKDRLELQEQYNEELQHALQELSRQRHEYANQLNIIAGLLETNGVNNIQESLDFIEKLLHEKGKTSNASFVCSDHLLSAMLYRKTKEAEQLNIHFGHSIAAPLPQYPLSSRDFMEILSNLLNNALESQAPLPVPAREVFLSLKERSIEVMNAVGADFDPQQIAHFDTLGFSTKGNDRGYGLANVKRIVDRSQGEIVIYLQEQTLVFCILFP